MWNSSEMIANHHSAMLISNKNVSAAIYDLFHVASGRVADLTLWVIITVQYESDREDETGASVMIFCIEASDFDSIQKMTNFTETNIEYATEITEGTWTNLSTIVGEKH